MPKHCKLNKGLFITIATLTFSMFILMMSINILTFKYITSVAGSSEPKQVDFGAVVLGVFDSLDN